MPSWPSTLTPSTVATSSPPRLAVCETPANVLTAQFFVYTPQHAVGMKLAFLAYEVQLPTTSIRAVETYRDVNRVGRATCVRTHRLKADIAAEWTDGVATAYIGKTVLRCAQFHNSPFLLLAPEPLLLCRYAQMLHLLLAYVTMTAYLRWAIVHGGGDIKTCNTVQHFETQTRRIREPGQSQTGALRVRSARG